MHTLFITVPPPPPAVASQVKVESGTSSNGRLIFGLSRGTFLLLIGLLIAVLGFLYFRSLREQEHLRIREKNKATEQYNALIQQKHLEFEAQQKELEEQERLARELAEEQERLEQIRQQENERILQEEKASGLLAELNLASQHLHTAKQQLARAQEFQVLRTQAERDRAIATAQAQVDRWQNEVKRLEKALQSTASEKIN